MSKESFYGITYYPPHVHRILRGGIKRGGSKVSGKEFDKEILGWIYTRTLMGYYELLPDGRISKALVNIDKKLPDELVDISWKIKRYLDEFGPFSPLAIGLMNCIINMERVGITDYKTYFELLEYLDENPADSFRDYVEKITKFEKELE